MEVFRHIQYATAGRFEEPVLVGFSEGRNEDHKPTACPQNPFRLGFLMGKQEVCEFSEDCQFLNIWTPSREGNYPVLIWIHGGAYIGGSGEESAYDAGSLSDEGDIVVVTISYRLGVFGYLYNHEGPTQNLGLKDQMMALRWVHENISHFGGDPQRVTLAGQSAGGHSVAALIATCKEPYFHKAIIQSAPLCIQFTKKYLKRQYKSFIKQLKKPYSDASVADMLHVQEELIVNSGKSMCFAPFVPGLLKEIAVPSLEKVLITWQKDDSSPFVAMRLNHEEKFGNIIDRLATLISTWIVFKMHGRRYAAFLKQKGIKVWTNELDWRPKASPFGACHCLELSLLFGTWERWKDIAMLGKTEEDEWKMRRNHLRSQWIEFIR